MENKTIKPFQKREVFTTEKSMNEYSVEEYKKIYEFSQKQPDVLMFIVRSLLQRGVYGNEEYDWVREELNNANLTVSYNNIMVHISSQLSEEETALAVFTMYAEKIKELTLENTKLEGKELMLKFLEEQNSLVINQLKKNKKDC